MEHYVHGNNCWFLRLQQVKLKKTLECDHCIVDSSMEDSLVVIMISKLCNKLAQLEVAEIVIHSNLMCIGEGLDVLEVEAEYSQAVNFCSNTMSNDDDISILWYKVCDFREQVGFGDSFDSSPTTARDVFDVVVVSAADVICCFEGVGGKVEHAQTCLTVAAVVCEAVDDFVWAFEVDWNDDW